jgi:TP901 family phage tail tape measure protein
MPGGLGDVNIKLNVDASSAFQTIKKVQDVFGEPIKGNPTEGLDKAFEKTAKAAKKLGFEWNAATQTFKGDGGKFNSTLSEMENNIKAVKDRAKEAGGSFGTFADYIKKAGAQASGLQGTTKSLADQFKAIQATAATGAGKIAAFGIASKNAGTSFGVLGTNAGILNNALRGVGQGGAEGLKNIGGIASDTGTKLKGLATQAGSTSTSVKQLGQGGNQGLKNIGNDAKGAATKLDGLETEAKAAKTALSGIGGGAATGLANLSGLVGKSEISFKQATSSAHRLTNAIEGTGKAGAPLGALARAIQGVGTAGKNAKTPTSALTKLLDRAALTAAPLGAVPPKIRAIGTAATTAKNATKGMGAELKKAADQSKNFSGAVQQGFQQILQGIPQGIGMAIGNALIAPLKLLTQIVPAAVSQYRDLDEVLRLTLAIAGESSSSFGRLADSVKKVGASSAATNQEVGQVAQALARAGFSLDEIESALAGVVQGAEATGMGYAEMGDIVVSALGQFQLGADKTTEAVDSMVTAANSSNQTVSDLGNALKYVGPVANTVGQSLDETNVQLALLANSGIKASTAGTSLRTILTNLQIAAGGAGEEFTELSRGSGRLVKTLGLIGADMTDTNGALKTGTDLIYALQSSMKTLSAGERAIVSKVLAGSEGLPALSAIVNATGEDIELLADKMDNKLGSAADTQKKAMEGLSGSLKFFESNLSTLLASVGQFASTLFKPLVDGATLVLAAFNKIPGPIQSIVFALATLATIAGAVKIALMALKVEIVATFAAKTVAMIQTFTAAITQGGVQAALVSMATNAGRLATILKTKLVVAIASSTTALNAMTLKLKAANAQLFFRNATKGAKQINLFADAAKRGITTTDGKVSALNKLKDAFKKGQGQTGKAATQLSLFATAGQGAAKGLGTATTAATASAVAMGKVAVPAGAAAAATATVGTAGTGAGLGLGALVGSISAFLGAVAPFAAIAVGVGIALKALIDYTGSYNKVLGQLEGDSIKLNKVLEDGVDVAEASEDRILSWSESLTRAIGPIGQFITKNNLMFASFKKGLDGVQFVTDGIGRFFTFLQDKGKIDAAKNSMNDLAKSMENGAIKINENQLAMKGLTITDEEYSEKLSDNINIQKAMVEAYKSRAAKLKVLLKDLEDNGRGESEVADTYRKNIAELQALTPAEEKHLKNLRDQQTLVQAVTGRNDELANSYQTVMRKRNDANAAIDTTLNGKLLQNQALLKQGLIDESVQRARNAKAAQDQIEAKLAEDEKALVALQGLRDEEKITELKFIELKEGIVKRVKEGAKDRATNEKAL